MDKFSVIIPTLWKCPEVTNTFIQTLINDDWVGEIIIIDNSGESKERLYWKSDKIVVLYPGENIYVNPAWNLGVKYSKFNNIVLASDDILIPEDFMKYYSYTLDRVDDIGVIGIPRQTIMDIDNLLPFHVYDTMSFDGVVERNWGYGVFMVMKKENYIPIPEELKIWSGDDFLFHKSISMDRVNGVMSMPVKTKMSFTSDLPEFNERKYKDLELYKEMNI